MSATSGDLWKLLRESRLMPPDRLEQMESAYAKLTAEERQPSARSLAEWLMSRKMLTRYQARVLLGGRSGPFRYGDYQVQERIRGGRLGGLFRALHLPSHYPVLLRFVPNRIAQDPRQWTITRQFIRNTRPIIHDQLQRVFVLEERSNYKFLVLEDLAGRSLDDELASAGRFPAAKASHVIRLAALGLAALHERRQIHGDLCPATLWFESRGNVKLIRNAVQPPLVPDFSRPGLTPSQLGQADYLAPELAQLGTRLGPLTDIYALGCTLYQLLADEVPFAGSDIAAKLRRHATQPPPQLDPFGVPKELADIVGRMLEKDVEARIESAAEIARQLIPFVEPSSVNNPAPPPTATLAAFERALEQPRSTGTPTPPAVLQGTVSPARSSPGPPATGPPDPTPPPALVSEPTLLEPAAAASVALTADQQTPIAIQVSAGRGYAPSPRRGRKTHRARRRRALLLSLLAASILLALLAYVVIDGDRLTGRNGSTPGSRDPAANLVIPRSPGDGDRIAAKSAPQEVEGRYEARDDDGAMLWMTPTKGDPIELKYLPPGPQLIIVVRPRDLALSAEGKRVMRALGPQLEAQRKHWEALSGFASEQVDQLVVSFHDAGEAFPHIAIVVSLHEPRSESELLRIWDNPTAVEYEAERYYSAQGSFFYVPDTSEPTRFVVSGEQEIKEIIQFGGTPPVMQREMFLLLNTSDRDRHVSVLFSPRFLFGNLFRDGRAFSFGDGRRVRLPLEWLLQDDLQAGIVSMQFGDLFFLELRGCGQANQDSLAMANALRQRVEEIPDRVVARFEQIYPSKYWRRVALKFPEMIRFLHRYTRVGVEDDQAIVNSVLPGPAAHNLIFAGQMLLAATSASNTAAPDAPVAGIPTSLAKLIETRMNLAFDQKSLEFAIRDLATEIKESHPNLPFEFDIVIIGTDLQLNGITRNQQISEFAARGKTLGEILTALVMRANPVTTVKNSAELDQKLIWVVGPDPTDPKRQVLLITTRDAATRRGYKLPLPFQTK